MTNTNYCWVVVNEMDYEGYSLPDKVFTTIETLFAEYPVIATPEIAAILTGRLYKDDVIVRCGKYERDIVVRCKLAM